MPPDLEGRAVHGRHGLVGEEGAQHLADHVRRDHPVDAEPGGEHRRERRLADPGGAADQHDQRPVEPVEPPPARGSGAAAVSPSSASSTSSASASQRLHVDLGLRRARPAARSISRASSNARSGDSADGRQRLRHQALRVGQAVALVDDDRLSASARAGATSASQLSASSTPTGRLRTNTTRAPALGGAAGDRVDRGRLQLGQVDVAAAPPRRAPGRRRARARRARLVEATTRLHALAGRRAGGEQRHARARPAAARPARAAARSARAAGRRRAPSCGAAPGRARSSAVVRERLRLAGADHADRAVDLHRRDAGARALEDERARLRRAPPRARRRRPRSTRHGAPARPAAHAPAADGAHARQHRVLEVVGRGVAAAARRPRAGPPAPCRPRRHARLGRPAAAHADDHRVALAQQRRPVAGHGGLAGALAGADHGELRARRRRPARSAAGRGAAPGAS